MINKGLRVDNAEEGEYYYFLFPSDLHVVTDNLPSQLISAICEHDNRRAQCKECGGR